MAGIGSAAPGIKGAGEVLTVAGLVLAVAQGLLPALLDLLLNRAQRDPAAMVRIRRGKDEIEIRGVGRLSPAEAAAMAVRPLRH